MKRIAIVVGILALLGTIVPPVLFLNGLLAHENMKLILFISCIPWFVSAPLWMKTE